MMEFDWCYLFSVLNRLQKFWKLEWPEPFSNGKGVAVSDSYSSAMCVHYWECIALKRQACFRYIKLAVPTCMLLLSVVKQINTIHEYSCLDHTGSASSVHPPAPNWSVKQITRTSYLENQKCPSKLWLALPVHVLVFLPCMISKILWLLFLSE